MKRLLLASALAAAFAAPAYSAPIPRGIDETDLSWQYLAPTAKPQFEGAAPAARTPVAIGDENDASWIYAPTAKPFFDGQAATATARPYVESNDENDLAWLYQAPSAGSFADPRRQEPYTGFGPTANPLAKVRQLFGKPQPTGE